MKAPKEIKNANLSLEETITALDEKNDRHSRMLLYWLSELRVLRTAAYTIEESMGPWRAGSYVKPSGEK